MTYDLTHNFNELGFDYVWLPVFYFGMLWCVGAKNTKFFCHLRKNALTLGRCKKMFFDILKIMTRTYSAKIFEKSYRNKSHNSMGSKKAAKQLPRAF